MNSQTNYGLEEAGMAQMDDSIGALLKHLDDIGEADNTIVIFTTDNGAEVFTWPDGGMTPFKATKGTVVRRRLPRAVHHPLAGQDQAGHGRERHLLRPRLVPDPRGCGRQPEHHRPAAEGRASSATGPTRTISTATTRWTCSPAKARPSAHEFFYFGGAQLGRGPPRRLQVHSSIQQPQGWPGEKVTTDMPVMVNIRQDPFERTPSIRGESLNDRRCGYMNDFYAREFWRFVLVQQDVGKLAQSTKTEPVVLPARIPEPADQRRDRHRRRHGDEHPAAQPRRGLHGAHQAARQPGPEQRAVVPLRQGTGLSDRRPDPQLARGAEGDLQDRLRRDPPARHLGGRSGDAQRADDLHHQHPVHGQQVRARRAHRRRRAVAASCRRSSTSRTSRPTTCGSRSS